MYKVETDYNFKKFMLAALTRDGSTVWCNVSTVYATV